MDPFILGEIRFGILLLPAGKRRQNLDRWFREGVAKVQCVAWEAARGMRWAKLLADLRASGQAMPIKDSLIAATALVHGFILVTRNVSDFRKAGVKMFDSFID